MKLFRAVLETPSFSFETFDTTSAGAIKLMHRLWDAHRKQHGGDGIWVWADVMDDVSVRPFTVPGAYRDGEWMNV